MTKEQFERWKNLPKHRYKVPIVGNCIDHYYEIVAPTKTMARSIVESITRPDIHVKGEIIDMGLAKNPFE